MGRRRLAVRLRSDFRGNRAKKSLPPCVQTTSRSPFRSPHCSADDPSGSRKFRFPFDLRRPLHNCPRLRLIRCRAGTKVAAVAHRPSADVTSARATLPMRSQYWKWLSRSRRCQTTTRLPSDAGSRRRPSSRVTFRQSGGFIRVALRVMEGQETAGCSRARAAPTRRVRRAVRPGLPTNCTTWRQRHQRSGHHAGRSRIIGVSSFCPKK